MSLLLSSLAVCALVLLIMVALERVRPRPRDLMPVIVLTVLAILGRVIAMPIPNFQPATALIILAGYYFGRHAGLLCGLLTALVSNMAMGQGPWTPWQMFAWGLVGYGAGFIAEWFEGLQRREKWQWANVQTMDDRTQRSSRVLRSKSDLMCVTIIITYGVVASLLFGAVMDFQFFVAYALDTGWSGLTTALVLGLPMNFSHATSTLAFLMLTLVPWGSKFARLKTKYDIRRL